MVSIIEAGSGSIGGRVREEEGRSRTWGEMRGMIYQEIEHVGKVQERLSWREMIRRAVRQESKIPERGDSLQVTVWKERRFG